MPTGERLQKLGWDTQSPTPRRKKKLKIKTVSPSRIMEYEKDEKKQKVDLRFDICTKLFVLVIIQFVLFVAYVQITAKQGNSQYLRQLASIAEFGIQLQETKPSESLAGESVMHGQGSHAQVNKELEEIWNELDEIQATIVRLDHNVQQRVMQKRLKHATDAAALGASPPFDMDELPEA